MKFKLCGGGDVPDWVLGAVPVLSRISCVRVALVAMQLLRELENQGGDDTSGTLESRKGEQKLKKLLDSRHCADAAEFEAVIAALRFLLISGVKYSVLDGEFENELLQLGLPRDTSGALRRRFKRFQENVATSMRDNVLKLPSLTIESWRVDVEIASSSGSVAPPQAALQVILSGRQRERMTINATSDMTHVLLHELKRAHSALINDV